MGNVIENKFEKIGARARFVEGRGPDFSVNVLRDRNGEYFELACGNEAVVTVLDVRPKDRHLLLLANVGGQRGPRTVRSRFLCGHDERHWFVAAVPESRPARDVSAAKDALKPEAVWESMRKHGVSMADRDLRKTAGFLRQGEWFFLPRRDLKVNLNFVLRNEPIRRGRGKPHICQELYRQGGERVHVCNRWPNGLTDLQFRSLSEEMRRKERWTVMRRNPRAYVRGTVRHPDHKTIYLAFWHEVVMNTETQAAAMRHVAFLD